MSAADGADFHFSFSAELWVYPGNGAWYFLTLPVAIAEQIKFMHSRPRGFGSVRVQATIASTQWETSIFPDKASNSFLLPVKAAIRRQESLAAGDCVAVELVVRV